MFVSGPDYADYMGRRRFEAIKMYIHGMFIDREEYYKGNQWWLVAGGVNDFNVTRKKMFVPHIAVLDECMSAFKPRTTKTGGLPNISYVFRKPKIWVQS